MKLWPYESGCSLVQRTDCVCVQCVYSVCMWTSRVHGVCAGFSWFLMAGVGRAPPVTGVCVQFFGQSWRGMKWDTRVFLSIVQSLWPPPDQIKQKDRMQHYTAPPAQYHFFPLHATGRPKRRVCACLCVCRGANVSENVTFAGWLWLVAGHTLGEGWSSY